MSMDAIPTSRDIPPKDPLHAVSPETLNEERQTKTLPRSRGALHLSLPTEHELESLHESFDTSRSSSHVTEDPLHAVSQQSLNEGRQTTTLSRSRGAMHLSLLTERALESLHESFDTSPSSSKVTENPLHALSQQSLTKEVQAATLPRTRGALRLPIPVLSRWPFSFPNLTREENEPLFPNVWQGRVSSAVRFLWQGDNTKDVPDESNKLQPLRSIKNSAVEALAFPFRQRSSPDGSISGTSATSRFINPFRSTQREAPMEPTVTENASLRDLMGTALPAISRQSSWDLLAVLMSQLTCWVAGGFAVIVSMLSSTPLQAWWDQVCQALSWPREILAKCIWFLQSMQHEARNVREGTGRKKYVFAAGASIAVQKASNIKVERPRLGRRPKRHSTRNGDW